MKEMKTSKEIMRDLVDRLNYLTLKYDEGRPEVSDKEWDDLYFQLLDMENKAGMYYIDSPTRAINYQVVNELNKVEHNHKMLSLDKTKSLEDVISFIDKQLAAVMAKVDGLTCSLRYINGKLVSAETRGNGVIGEDVLHNALTIPTIPHRINYEDELIVDGEIVCLLNDFEQFSEEYKNPRNFASGSIRLLDAKECANRKLTFVAWDVIKGFDDNNSFSDRLMKLRELGFFIVPFIKTYNIDDGLIDVVKTISNKAYVPIDGLVFKFDDIAYGKAQGETAHHFKNAIAYKFYDEIYGTILRNISWTMGRTGVLTPVAVFDAIDIEGSMVERANLHNVSIMKETLGTPWNGQSIGVFKANMIIPQIGWADLETTPEKDKILSIPTVCPICGGALVERRDNDSIFLECDNDACEGKLINRLDHFCGKKGLDIKGLSQATLEKLVDWGWLNNLTDIYSLKEHREEWIVKPGFGEKSVQNILNAIEASKNCNFEAFISSLGIPLIGKNVAKELVKHFSCYEELRKAVEEKYDFSQLPNFGDTKSKALLDFDYTEANKLYDILNIKLEETAIEDINKTLSGKKYVITGTVKQFKNRAELQTFIEQHGGKVMSSVSKNVDYLINNDATSTSAKNVAAKKLGIPILTEVEFLETLN